MHFPYYLNFGGVSLHPHLVFEALAYFLGFRLYLFLRSRRGDTVSPGNRWWAITAAAFGGALGSKVLYWLEDPAQTFARWRDLEYMMSGKAIVGGLIGGLIAVEVVKRLVGEKQRTGDLFAAPLCFGIAIGRIGCFLTGLADQTYGTATSLPWGIDLGDGIRRHPVQLYEVLFTIALGTWLWRFTTRPHESGDAFKIFMVGYMSFRLATDFLKPGVSLAGMTTIQWSCLLALIYYSRDVLRWADLREGGAEGAAAGGVNG